jgi:TIR domain-containing protein/NB-ARC domain-containing protein
MKDFFISYNKADRKWAEWIAWQLEEASYTTIIQAWDFKAGGNFILAMDQATKEAERTVAVLSEDYLKSLYTQPEWADAFRRDPTSEQGLLMPVRVQECTLSGLLAAVVYIDLVGLDEETAQEALLEQARPGRGKPKTVPSFPGSSPHTLTKKPVFPNDLPWNVPVKRNPFFTGREEPLEELEKHLNSGGSAALTGLGGVGKTQTAAEYAYRHRGAYQAILWVSANSQEALISSVVVLAGLLNLPEKDATDQALILAAVQRWLTTHRDFLLILDNADDLKLAQSFLPAGRQGHLLMTTRTQATGSLAPKVEIQKMGPEEGTLFLLRRTQRIGRDATLETVSETDRENALALCKEMGGLPLALDQAGVPGSSLFHVGIIS